MYTSNITKGIHPSPAGTGQTKGLKMNTLITLAMVRDFLNSHRMQNVQTCSTGGRPSSDTRAAIDSVMGDFSAKDVDDLDIESALENAGEETTVEEAARWAASNAADAFAMKKLEGEFGGNVTDGCSFEVFFGG